MDELQTLMGDAYHEGITTEEIATFFKGKKFADLSTGKYVDKNKYDNEVNTLKATIAERDSSLRSKMTEDEQREANEKAKDAEIKRLLELVNQQAMDTNKSKAMASTSEIKTLLGLKDDDADYDDFLSNIVSDNAEKTSKIATYVNKIVKDSYEKGKKDAMKDGLGNMGKGGKSSTGNSDVGALGKELAQKNIVNKSDFDYFKSN